jgi:hypothetical protein
MVKTRQSTQASKDVSKAQDVNNKENEPPAGAPAQQHNKASAIKRGSKRKSALDESFSDGTKPNKRKASSTDTTDLTATPAKQGNQETASGTEGRITKPCLTTPDLEFDYDRSQMRDPRPTPGRDARPRYGSFDIPDGLKAHLEATRDIPKPEKPKGRLNAAQEDDLFKAESRMNPLMTFHDHYHCYDKGKEGSPTYDNAGFELDYDREAKSLKPQAYNKKRMVRGVEKTLEKEAREKNEMTALFFVNTPQRLEYNVVDYMKDRVSKDLGVPWHQIGPEYFKAWREKGFQPVKYEEWWTEPTEEETKRLMKMREGSLFRKIF